MKNPGIPEVMKYEVQELWYGMAYREKGKDGSKKERADIDRIINSCNEHLSEIYEIVDGEFRPYFFADRIIDKATYVGTHIIFPLLVFEKEFNLARVEFECRIRINPCPERKQHYGKIWTIIGAKSTQQSGKLNSFFNSTIRYAEDIEKAIRNIVYEAENSNNGLSAYTEYPIVIKNIGSSEIDSEHGIFRLIETDREEEADHLLNQTEVRNILRDILVLHGKNGSREPSLKDLQESGIRWKSMKSYNQMGERNFIYGCNPSDECYQIAGFSNVGEIAHLHNFFRQTVLQMINAL